MRRRCRIIAGTHVIRVPPRGPIPPPGNRPEAAVHRRDNEGMSAGTTAPGSGRSVETVERVAIRFAGDSGDGMQLTGNQFTATTAAIGNDLATFPDYPAEIRAPAGTLPGVSGFQINFSSEAVLTPGDAPDVLVAMNPAALRVNIGDVKPGGNRHCQHRCVSPRRPAEGRLRGANPLDDGSLDGFLPVQGRIDPPDPRRPEGNGTSRRRSSTGARTSSRSA